MQARTPGQEFLANLEAITVSDLADAMSIFMNPANGDDFYESAISKGEGLPERMRKLLDEMNSLYSLASNDAEITYSGTTIYTSLRKFFDANGITFEIAAKLKILIEWLSHNQAPQLAAKITVLEAVIDSINFDNEYGLEWRDYETKITTNENIYRSSMEFIDLEDKLNSSKIEKTELKRLNELRKKLENSNKSHNECKKEIRDEFNNKSETCKNKYVSEIKHLLNDSKKPKQKNLKEQKHLTLQIFINLLSSLDVNKTYSNDEVLREFYKAKNAIFSGQISPLEFNEIEKAKYLLIKQLQSPRIKNSSSLSAKEVQDSIHRAGCLHAMDETEETLKRKFLLALNSDKNEETIKTTTANDRAPRVKDSPFSLAQDRLLTVLKPLSELYAPEIEANSQQGIFYKAISNTAFLDSMCMDAFKKTFYKDLTQAIDTVLDVMPITTTRQALADKNKLMPEIANDGVRRSFARQYFEHGDGGEKGKAQIIRDAMRDVRIGHISMLGRPADDSPTTHEIEGILTTALGAKAANQIILGHSQGHLDLVKGVLSQSVPIEELKIVSPGYFSQRLVVSVIDSVPAKPDLDTFYCVYSENAWSLQYIDFYGKQINIDLSEVIGLKQFLADKKKETFQNSDSQQLKDILRPYRFERFIKPLYSQGYIVYPGEEDAYFISYSQLYPLEFENKIVGCLGSAINIFKFKDKGKLNFEIRHTNDCIDPESIKMNTYVFVINSQNKKSCLFKNSENIMIDIDLEHIHTNIQEILNKISYENELTNLAKQGIEDVLATMRYGFELVDIKTNDSYIDHAFNGQECNKEEVLQYAAFHKACHELQEEIKSKRRSGVSNHYLLIQAENNLSEAIAFYGRAPESGKTVLLSSIQATKESLLDADLSNSKSWKKIPSIHEATRSALINDIITQLPKISTNAQLQGHDGVSKMAKACNLRGKSPQEKFEYIEIEAHERISRYTSMGSFLKNSPLHWFSPRTDQTELLYRSIANIDKNLKLNPCATTLQQILKTEQKRRALNIFDSEIQRLRMPYVSGTGLFGGVGVIKDNTISYDAKKKIEAYQDLKRIITASDADKDLSSLLNYIFKEEINSTIKLALFKKQNSFGIMASTSENVIRDLMDETIDLESMLPDDVNHAAPNINANKL